MQALRDGTAGMTSLPVRQKHQMHFTDTCRLSIPLSILIFGPCFRHTLECTKVEDTSTQLKQTTKQPCKQKVLVVKSSIFTLEKISLHKFGIEFNQKFNVGVRIRCTTSYDLAKITKPIFFVQQWGGDRQLRNKSSTNTVTNHNN